MKEYIHKVHYYETDKMGVTHHSNYIRWMEEARVDFLDQINFSYDKLEKDGMISPVIGVECDYKISTKFDDIVFINVAVEEYNSVKLVIRYVMKNAKTNEIVAIGKTKHCFLNLENRPLILKKAFPEFDKKLRELKEKN